MKNKFERIFHIWAEKNPWYIADTMSALYSLYAQAIQSLNRYYVKINPKFSDIISFILQNYSDPLFSVSNIANFADVSEVYLRRMFRSALNISPMRYVIFLRLEKAKNMLVTSNYTIEEISLASGFSDPYYFSRLFKKEFGIPPSKYRKQNGNL